MSLLHKKPQSLLMSFSKTEKAERPRLAECHSVEDFLTLCGLLIGTNSTGVHGLD